MKTHNNTEKLKKMTGIALFAALSFLSMFVVRINGIGGFLTMDLKDAIIAICAMFFGPAAAVVLSVLVPLLEFLTISSTGWYGLVMNFLSSFAFCFTASLIYKYKKTFFGAVVGLLTATAVVTAVMMMANLWITPMYLAQHGMSMDIVAMIPKLFLPFNFVKYVFNASVTMMLYKPFTTVIRKTGFFGKSTETEEKKKRSKWHTVTVSVTGLMLAAFSLWIIIAIWGGNFSFF